MKPKEYLLKNGHIDEIKRGRLSREHIDIIKAAVAGGENIEGYTLNTPAAGIPEKATNAVERNKPEVGKIIYEIPPERFPESEYTVFERVDGKRVTRSLREACNNCRVSLIYCFCDSPRIVARNGRGSVLVYIERKQC